MCQRSMICCGIQKISLQLGLFCASLKNNVVAEYALWDVHKPFSVSADQLQQPRPESLQGILPTIEQLELELELGTVAIGALNDIAIAKSIFSPSFNETLGKE